MKKTTYGVAAAALAIGTSLLIPSGLVAYPEPSLISRSWELSFTFDSPKTIAVRGMDRAIRWYWYMPYKVVNNTGKEQYFVPRVTIATNRGDIITAGQGVMPTVFGAIKAALNNPLLEDPLQVSGRILVGEDHAKEAVAIWPVFQHDVDEMRLFVAGLSGESKSISHPLTDREISLRKTKMFVFRTPGTHVSPQRQKIAFETETWVMR